MESFEIREARVENECKSCKEINNFVTPSVEIYSCADQCVSTSHLTSSASSSTGKSDCRRCLSMMLVRCAEDDTHAYTSFLSEAIQCRSAFVSCVAHHKLQIMRPAPSVQCTRASFFNSSLDSFNITTHIRSAVVSLSNKLVHAQSKVR